ncbi:hypothetical protein [Paraburkholderia sp. CNPSo 3272]|nr:hypothetical protein [Paraburkholderia sp. CNPSo 3272]
MSAMDDTISTNNATKYAIKESSKSTSAPTCFGAFIRAIVAPAQ